MAYTFSNEEAATFKVTLVNEATETSETLTLRGINANTANAAVICSGVDMLLAIAKLTVSSYDGAQRQVTQDVYDND